MVADFEEELLRYFKALLKEQKISNALMKTLLEAQGLQAPQAPLPAPKKKPTAEVIRRAWIK